MTALGEAQVKQLEEIRLNLRATVAERLPP
jgi:hypothetical protein